MPDDDDLLRVLSEIQRRGAIGRSVLSEQVAHAESFVRALPPFARRIVDLGSGGGLPGLVIAHRRRDLHVVLIERRAKRVDLLRYGVRALQLDDTVQVAEGDAVELGASGGYPADVVTARSYGPVRVVLETAAPFLQAGGVVLVSEPPGQVRDAGVAGASSGFQDAGVSDGIHRFERFHVEHSTL
ncbi:MAG: RsmG family class I SAM-dependent methyltransferase [Ilumatobacteraceae bacterium]